MPEDEVTGKRPMMCPNCGYRFKRDPSAYSTWHRQNLPKECYMADGDFFEQREINGRYHNVAYIETIQTDNLLGVLMGEYPVWSDKDAVCRDIQEMMKIPCFIVYHNSTLTDFIVRRYGEKTFMPMTASEYIAFILANFPPGKVFG